MYESHWNTLPHKGYSKTNDTLDLSFETLKKKNKKNLVNYKKNGKCRMKTYAL